MNDATSDIGIVFNDCFDIWLTTTALVTGASNMGLKNATIPMYIIFSIGIDIGTIVCNELRYLCDNKLEYKDPKPEPIVMDGITIPPDNPAPREIIQLIIFPPTFL